MIQQIFESQKKHALQLKLSSANERLFKLKKIAKYLKDKKNEQALFEALKKDLGKSESEALMTELGIILTTIKEISRNLRTWMWDKKVTTPLPLTGASSYIKCEAKGVCLIISPWNYPFQLALNPLLFCIAAGNTAIIKPSEYSRYTSAFLKSMLGELFNENEVCVIEGAVETSTQLLALAFDHIYFTGSTKVGKIVMSAAAKHLSSVTLELGGKSPCIIDDFASLKSAAKKIAWAKLLNNGQTCIAPDYITLPQNKTQTFSEYLIHSIKQFFGDTPTEIKRSNSYGRIISERHFDRAVALLDDAKEKGAKVLFGGEHDKAELFFSPTVLSNVTEDMHILREEIFCPIIPIVEYQNMDDLLDRLGEKDKPLALYLFSSNKKRTKYILNRTTAGSTVVNDCVIQYANGNLPFGGVNQSGIGKSHGKHGFLQFSNERAVMKQHFGATWLMHPPFTKNTRRLLRFMFRWLS